jgi:hypothetical protein
MPDVCVVIKQKLNRHVQMRKASAIGRSFGRVLSNLSAVQVNLGTSLHRRVMAM